MIFSLCFGLVLKKMETWKTKNTLLYEMDATGSGTKPSCCIQNHYICDSGWELCLCQLVQLFPRHGFQLPIAETNILSCKEKPKIRSSALQKASYVLTWRTGSNWRIYNKILLNLEHLGGHTALALSWAGHPVLTQLVLWTQCNTQNWSWH